MFPQVALPYQRKDTMKPTEVLTVNAAIERLRAGSADSTFKFERRKLAQHMENQRDIGDPMCDAGCMGIAEHIVNTCETEQDIDDFMQAINDQQSIPVFDDEMSANNHPSDDLRSTVLP